ncbi:deoxyribodipyrimidine photo-lyase [Prolixibacter sp. NT017]|uniref:cryptochrome/photolyase family protein n=1 Tax=Prolixibacter sp. NT017 TaxID=2652390 RepID=UPI001286B04C|nr:deoxyribodipyrimidine photo-lyase [Prolixibacter sp. NT017]GET24773.1 deoxyribodipyrimidine photo-lyase [Prolixibacter sp. NT017]
MRKKEKAVVSIFWFRRDLRLEDNIGLMHALKTRENVLPVFIFDPEIFQRDQKNRNVQVGFVYDALLSIKEKLETLGSDLYVAAGKPLDVFKTLMETYHIFSVYANREYEPYTLQRDEEIASFLNQHEVEFHTYKDHVLFEKDEIVKDNGEPYTVFTAYKQRFLRKLNQSMVVPAPISKYAHNFFRTMPIPMPSLEEMKYSRVDVPIPPRKLPAELLKSYESERDFPARNGTSHLSVHLRFGTVSIRKVTALAMQHSDTFLSELIWRNFYSVILWFFPEVVHRSFKPAYDDIVWENKKEQFEAWCEGRTGYPLVDAGMRELNATGYMHNRVRMVVASFLCKHLLIDWRWGEAYFASKLLDYDLASNNGGWQWAAGSGNDAAPYFRVFNPELQAKKFDPKGEYIVKWVPEYGTMSYPKPIVVHAEARERALTRYAEAVKAKA